MFSVSREICMMGSIVEKYGCECVFLDVFMSFYDDLKIGRQSRNLWEEMFSREKNYSPPFVSRQQRNGLTNH